MWTIITSAFSSGLSFLAPVASAVLAALKVIWGWIIVAAGWIWRQAVAAPAWTAVLLGIVLLAYWWSGSVGYSRGVTDGMATAAANLNQCHTNVSHLESALKDQNAKIAVLGKQGDTLKADAAAKASKAQADITALQRRLAALLVAKPVGKTEAERAAAARRQIEEDLAR